MEPEALNKMLGEMDLPSWINFPDFERVRWVNAGARPLQQQGLSRSNGCHVCSKAQRFH